VSEITAEGNLQEGTIPQLGNPFLHEINGQQPVVFQPAATSNIRVAISMTYGRCRNNPFEPPLLFKFAAAEVGNRNSDGTI
jgi:hypothetical protein